MGEATTERTKMHASPAHLQLLKGYGAIGGGGRRHLALVANRCRPISRLREAVGYRGYIVQQAMVSTRQPEDAGRQK